MELLKIGLIVNTQGIKGDLRIVPSTDDITRFNKLKTILLIKDNTTLEVTIERVWYHKTFVILKLKDIDDMTSAEKLKGYEVKIPRSDALPLAENEFYIGDLIGLKVQSSEGENLGAIYDILQTGANDVYVVKDENGNEVLIPAVKKYVLSIDLENSIMIVNIEDGLRQ